MKIGLDRQLPDVRGTKPLPLCDHLHSQQTIFHARMAAEAAAARALSEALEAVGGSMKGSPKGRKIGTFCNKELVEYLATRKAEEGKTRSKKLANQTSDDSQWAEEDGEYADDDFEFEDDDGVANPQSDGKGKSG